MIGGAANPRPSQHPWLRIARDQARLDFFAVTDQIKLGVQAVNLLDEVTRTTQVVDFDGTRITRSAFRNDRRYTFVARFDF